MSSPELLRSHVVKPAECDEDRVSRNAALSTGIAIQDGLILEKGFSPEHAEKWATTFYLISRLGLPHPGNQNTSHVSGLELESQKPRDNRPGNRYDAFTGPRNRGQAPARLSGR